jgi:exodeoxyribonuclease-3
LATWNINSLKVRLGRVEEWLTYAQPDVLCLQETKLADGAFPALSFAALGYESACTGGDGRWNGVAILSRVGLEDVAVGFDPGVEGTAPADEYTGSVLAEPRLLSATCAGIRVCTVYVPNGRTVTDPHYLAKLEWLARLRQHVALTCSPDRPAAVLGDFNIAPEDRDVYDPAAFVGSTHTTPEERAHLAEFAAWGLTDAFRRLYDDGRLYSWWDYRAGDFHQGRGLRIDLVLVTRPLAERVRWALIDRNARKGKQPSDHAPVIVDFDLAGEGGTTA